MNKCKYFRCEKEVNEGERYCKRHKNKIENIRKTAVQAIPTIGALAVAVVLKKKPPTNS